MQSIKNVEIFLRELCRGSRWNLLGFVPRTYEKKSSISVWTEIEYFMCDDNPKDPTKMPDELFLKYDYMKHNYHYDKNPNSLAGEFISYL